MVATKTKKGASAPAYAGTVTKVCPKCSKRRRIDDGFGFRKINGVDKPQSWCRDCRKTTRYEPTVEMEVLVVDDEPLPIDAMVYILDRDAKTTLALYRRVFPSDKQRRPWSFMAKKLVKKLGSELLLTPAADVELNGVGI